VKKNIESYNVKILIHIVFLRVDISLSKIFLVDITQFHFCLVSGIFERVPARQYDSEKIFYKHHYLINLAMTKQFTVCEFPSQESYAAFVYKK
jgi:hypothetical protein